MSISVIIPTIGRPSLRETLESFITQLEPLDEVLVIGDGPQEQARTIARDFGAQVRYLECEGPANNWGATPRNYGIEQAKGTNLAFMDDDDIYLPDAFRAFRNALRNQLSQIHLFRMYNERQVIWRRPRIESGNVSTQIFLVPNIPDRLSRWSTDYEGDLHFIRETVKLHPAGNVAWHHEIVARLSKHRVGIP